MDGQKDLVKKFEKYVRVWNNILSFLGVSPVADQINQKGEVTYRVSLWRMFVSVAIIALSVTVVYIQIWDKKFDIANIGGIVISGYLNVTGNVVTCLNIFSAIWNSRGYAALLSSFLTCNEQSFHARVEVVLKISAKFISFFMIVLCLSFCFGFLILEKDSDVISMLFLLNYISELYNFLCVCQFAVCCFWLREYLSRINIEIGKYTNLSVQRVGIYRTRAEFLKLNSILPEATHIQSMIPTAEGNFSRMKFIRRRYHQVYLLSIRVNGVFSTRNLIIVAHNFFLGTILIYCGLGETVKYFNNKTSLTVMEIVNYFKLSLMSFISIYGLIWPSTKVYSEVQTTATLVQEFFTKVSKGELQSELHSFVMQLFHENICFSPHGFFSLNNKLLLSIIGSVASYLVILVQFRVIVT